MPNLAVSLALVGLCALTTTSCPQLDAPVDGAAVREFAPIGRYGGHWGIDFAAAAGSEVSAAEGGTVTFAGEVAGILSVTVHHGGGLRTSYSYLSEILVAGGARVDTGSLIGRSGVDHDMEAVHFSVRIGDDYQDPADWLRCLSAPQPGLSLLPPPSAYPAGRATRHPRRNIRSPSSGSPVCG